MHALLRFRSAVFALFALFDVLNIAFAAWNLTVMGPTSASIAIYTLTVSAIGLLVVGGMIVMEQRTGSPRLWLEIAWVGFFALLSLGSAAATTALLPVATCGMSQAKTNYQFCTSSNAVVATNWLAAITYLGWFISMIIYNITRSSSDRDVWIKGIKDVERRLGNGSDATLNEKIATLPTLHHRPETRTSGYSVSTENEKGDISIVIPFQYRNGPIGVDAINGAPVYHPYGITNTWNQRNGEQSRLVTPIPASIGNFGPTGSPQTVEVPPRQPFFVAPSYAMSTGGSSVEFNGSNPSSGFEWISTAYKNTASLSPAIIMQAHKVPAQQALYGPHAAGTDGHRRTRSNTDPTRGQWFPSHGKTNQSNVVLVDDRRPSEGGVGQTLQLPFRMGHAPALSTDSALGVGIKKPKHRPPPLDLSRLSNVKQAEKR
jgi:predicted secreted protein